MLSKFMTTSLTDQTLNGQGEMRVNRILHSNELDAYTVGNEFHLVFKHLGRREAGRELLPSPTPNEAVFALAQERLSEEIDAIVSEYRRMLRETLATGIDTELQAALNRARVQEKLLASVPCVDQTEACILLGLSTSNPSATMKRKEERGEVLRFTLEGRAAYPLLQFDVEGRRVFPGVQKILSLAPRTWSNFRILHWLIRPHLDFESTPAAALGTEEERVLEAFSREIEPADHG